MRACEGAAARASRPVRAAMLLACVTLAGCAQFGPGRLDDDQIGYSRALSDAQKRQTLLNIVRLRYADTPTFLDATQVISSYQLQRNVTGGFEAFPAAQPSTYLSGSGSFQLQQSPTFTFQPVTGEQFAETFMRPLPPSSLLPFILGGLPIDVLFRLGVQSVNALDNATALTRDANGGSPGFFLLLHDLRLLQIAGLLGVRLEHEGSGDRNAKAIGRVFLLVSPTDDPELAQVSAEGKRLLRMKPRATEAEILYGRIPPKAGQIAILTRSILAVLNEIGSQIDVPPGDIASGRTLPTVGDVGIERRPVIVVRSGPDAPADAFAAVRYHDTAFWIADDDFDSKLAFTTVQILLALATATTTGPGTIITIPTG